jgi:hypothetical protein
VEEGYAIFAPIAPIFESKSFHHLPTGI